MKEIEDEERGRRLLTAVERILDDTGNIVALVDRHTRVVRQMLPDASEERVRDEVAQRIVSHYSNATAVSGGASALPSLIPGLGTMVTLTGGTLVDVALMLKFEVEMALALCRVFGYDITQERERELAFLLASVSTAQVQSGDSFVKDVAVTQGVAIWNYAPRQVPKILVQILARLAARGAARGVLRSLPVVGVVVGTVLNKTLTERVGRRCIRELGLRPETEASEEPEEEVVDAVIVSRPPARRRSSKPRASKGPKPVAGGRRSSRKAGKGRGKS